MEKVRLPILRPPVQHSSVPRADGVRVQHDAVPHLCHIELTYACNERCIFCYNPGRERLGDMEKIDRIVSSIAASRVPHVYLIGGEPSLFPVDRLNMYIRQLAPTSSVTIVTNGLKRLRGISSDLACFGVPLHGADAKTHEFLNASPGSFRKTLETIRAYVSEGHDVRCIPVLTGYNFDQMYDIIRIAAELGMESIYVDRYEDGGLGAVSGDRQLKPTREQFSVALGQMIQARRDFAGVFGGRIGFGTAIPYCLDERLVMEGLTSNCGVGTYFCAINPDGEFRMCNQSQIVFGNVLERPLEDIWTDPALDMFRDLSWADEPCASCALLADCTGGCKVDTTCSDRFCIDYAVRGLTPPALEYVQKVRHRASETSFPMGLRVFRPNRYTKLTLHYPQKLLVTRYQTVRLEDVAVELAELVLKGGIVNEGQLIERFATRVEATQIRRFVSQMLQVGALDLIGELPHASP